MRSSGHALILAILAAWASDAAAVTSPCANLPTSGPVGGTSNVEVTVPPTRRRNGTLACPDRYRLVTRGGPPRCVGLAGAPVMGNPQAQCYANMPLTVPVTGTRPLFGRGKVPECPAQQRAGLRLRGSNIGFSDINIAPVPAGGITITPARASGGNVPPGEDPALTQCPPTSCILLKLRFAPDAADNAVIRFAVPGKHFDYPIGTAPKCPPPPQPVRADCPVYSGGSLPNRPCP